MAGLAGLDAKALLVGLNPNQKKAVKHSTGPALVLAGAGTGKTKVITTRIAYLIAQKKALPEEILALTFTDKAAQEMQGRVDELLPYGYVETQIMTFHALGGQLIRDYAIDMQINLKSRLATSLQQYILLQDVLEEQPKLELFRPAHNPTQFIEVLLAYFSRLKDEALTPLGFAKSIDDIAQSNKVIPQEDIAKYQEISLIYTAYELRKREQGFIDFGDQLLLPYQLMCEKPHIAEKIQNMYKYLLVDEFQDTNSIQGKLMYMLSKKHQNIMVVGDDDQSIYRFRGAELQNILDFSDIYPDVTKIVLTENYRSSQSIVDAGYELIQHNNPHRLESKLNIPKKLRAQRSGVEPVVLHSDDNQLELRAVVTEVQKGVEEYGANGVAVLVRNNRQAEEVMRALEHAHIPVASQLTRQLFQQPVVRQCIDFIRVLQDPSDSSSLYRYLLSPKIQAQASRVVELSSSARRHHQTLMQAIESSSEENRYLKDQLLQLEVYRESIRERSAGEILYEFISSDEYLSQLVANAQADVESARMVQYLAKFFSLLQELESVEQLRSTHELWMHLRRMYELEILIEVDDVEQSEGVKILTIHRSKGLEFDVVVLYDLTEGAFPATRRSEPLLLPQQIGQDIREVGLLHLSEERRLFYVAITRAKHRLVVSYSNDHGGKRMRKPSQFLLEAFNYKAPLQRESMTVSTGAIDQFAASRALDQKPRFTEHDGWLYLTPNQIADYIADPANFYVRHVLSFPDKPSHHFVYGTAIHAALEAYLEQRLIGNALPVKKMIEVFHDAWQHNGFVSFRHEQERLQNGVITLNRVYQEFEAQTDLSIHAVEKSFELFLHDQKVRIKGRFDVILNQGKGVEIRDFKTSAVANLRNASDRLRDSVPMQIYALAWSMSSDLSVEAISLHFVESGVVAQRPKSKIDNDKTLKKIQQVADGIRQQDYPSRAFRRNLESEGLI
ncbi:MAG: ATP-dependent DNA helicase [bacterium]